MEDQVNLLERNFVKKLTKLSLMVTMKKRTNVVEIGFLDQDKKCKLLNKKNLITLFSRNSFTIQRPIPLNNNYVLPITGTDSVDTLYCGKMS